jgi:hypothetical protein
VVPRLVGDGNVCVGLRPKKLILAYNLVRIRSCWHPRRENCTAATNLLAPTAPAFFTIGPRRSTMRVPQQPARAVSSSLIRDKRLAFDAGKLKLDSSKF